MAHLIQKTGGGLIVTQYDRALRLAKKLTRLLRDELGQEGFRLHMAQKAVAAGLRCQHFHAMMKAEYPRAWDGGRATAALTDGGFVPDAARARQAVALLEVLFAFVPQAATSAVANDQIDAAAA